MTSLLSNAVNILARLTPNEHSFFTSESVSNKAKLNFADPEEAEKFLTWFKETTADPNDELWKVSSKKTPKKKPAKHRKNKIEKTAISSPCNFAHITRIELFSEQLQKQLNRHSMSDESTLRRAEAMEFRPRLPTS